MTSFIAYYMISVGCSFILLGICLVGIGIELSSAKRIFF